jgi:RNA polymerase-binding transcription factor DksA
MSKKNTSKSKPVSKNKAKKSPTVKKAIRNKIKPATKKAPSKVKPKAKPVAKKAQKPAPKKAEKAKKPVVKAKQPVKSKPEIKKVTENKKPVNPAKPTENSADAAKSNVPQNRPTIGRPAPVNRRPEPARAIISNSKPEKETGKNRYSDNELEEFREIINRKLENARKELSLLQAQMTAANEHGTDDTASTFKILEDGSDSLAKEEAGQLASRQKKFIEQLENALVRIENKTYGICRVTGKLIPKERLRAVPHTTQSIEAKLNQYRD